MLRYVLSPATIILCRHGVYRDAVCSCCDDDVTDDSDEDDDHEDRSHGDDYSDGRLNDDSDEAGTRTMVTMTERGAHWRWGRWRRGRGRW